MSEDPGNANLPIGALKPANQEIGVPGWHSRGYLPHFERAELIQHVTFHLADSMAKDAVERMDAEIRYLPPEKRDAERRKRIQAWMDAGQAHAYCVNLPLRAWCRIRSCSSTASGTGCWPGS
jgi:putative transposase